jgi:hypothetical protein
LSVRWWQGGELDRKGAGGGHAVHIGVPAHSAYTVPAREEDAEALHKALSLGAWHWHRGGAVAMTVISCRSRATRRLGGSAAFQR